MFGKKTERGVVPSVKNSLIKGRFMYILTNNGEYIADFRVAQVHQNFSSAPLTLQVRAKQKKKCVRLNQKYKHWVKLVIITVTLKVIV